MSDDGLPDPDSPSPVHRCEVPGCEFTTPLPGGLGPHYAAHRRRGDEGVPEPKDGGKPKPKKKRTRPKSKVGPADIVDGVLALLYPDSVPTDRVREVAAWIEATERMAADALARQ